jgi:hypothetical protein
VSACYWLLLATGYCQSLPLVVLAAAGSWAWGVRLSC